MWYAALQRRREAMSVALRACAFGFAPGVVAPVYGTPTAAVLPIRRIRTTLRRRTRPGTPPPISAQLSTPDGSTRREDDTSQTHAPLANLHELTERISDLLDIGSLAKSRSSPSMDMSDERNGHLNASLHVVVLFGKRLIRDQVSVEYAKRIVTLVKQLASRAIEPELICFTGGRTSGGCVSEAAAGYAFFRSVCEEAGLDATQYSYMLEEKSTNTLQNVQNVISALKRRCTPELISNCHFTLVSSDYHLIRLQEVHRLNSLDSALHPLRLFSATWSYIFAAYPFCVSRDPATAFLGRAVVLANDLSIVLVNITCAVQLGRFVAKENLHRLQETFAKMREMYRVIDARSLSGFKTDMRKHAETVELSIHRVREVNTILLPMHEDGGNVSKEDLQLAQRLLLTVVRDIRESMDPDRVLFVSDRLAVANDIASHIKSNRGTKDGGGDGGKSTDDTEDDDDDTGSNLSGGVETEGSGKTRQKSKSNQVQRQERSEMKNGRSELAGDSELPPYVTSELAGHGGARFAGNGKRIARDGPNVVVVEEAKESTLNILEELAAQRGNALGARLDDATSDVEVPVKTKRPRGRPVGSRTQTTRTRSLRTATTPATAQPARKRRGRTPAKRKTSTSKTADAD